MPKQQNIPESADKAPKPAKPGTVKPPAAEYGGPKGAEPTRYGDWEINGKCVDF